MSTFSERLQAFIRHEGLTLHGFNKACGFTKGLISKSLAHEGMNSTTLAVILARYPHLSADWLITGRGEMLVGSGSGATGRPAGAAQSTLPVRPFAGRGHAAPAPLPPALQASPANQVIWHLLLMDGGYQVRRDRLAATVDRLAAVGGRTEALTAALRRVQRLIEANYQTQPQDDGLYEQLLRAIVETGDGAQAPAQLADADVLWAHLMAYLMGEP